MLHKKYNIFAKKKVRFNGVINCSKLEKIEREEARGTEQIQCIEKCWKLYQ
jgi:hypothetical protein